MSVGRVGGRELAVFLTLVGALTGLVLFLSDGAILFTRPFWVDEWLAVFIANRSSPTAVLGDMAAGADGGAPLLHLGLWAMRHLVGELTPIVVRALSLVSVLMALLFVFLTLRRRHAFGAAAAGALAVGTPVLVVAHSYEGRFYGTLLLFSALVAWLLGRVQDVSRPGIGAAAATQAHSRLSRRLAIALGAAAFVLCGIHPYGVLSLGLLVAGGIAAYRREWRRGVRDAAPTTAGLVALLLTVPFALGQRSAYTVPTWLPDFAPEQLLGLLASLWDPTVALIAAALVILGVAMRAWRRERGALSVAIGTLSDAGALSLLALAFIPMALASVSVLGQPSMLPRYAITFALAWAPCIALACQYAGRWPTRVTCALLAWLWFAAYVKETRMKTLFAMGVAQSQRAHAQAQDMGLPIVVQSIHVMYPLIGHAPRESPGYFLSLSDSTFRALFPGRARSQSSRSLMLERDLARIHHERWGFPRLVTSAALDTADRFLLIGPRPFGFASMPALAARLFPNHRLTRLMPELLLLERVGSQASSK